MISERTYKILAVIALGVSLFFALVSLSGAPSTMGAGILTFLLIFSSLSCAAVAAGAWLFVRAKEKERIPVLYGAAVGVLFALAASLVVIMVPKVGLLTALMVFAISAALTGLFYGGARNISAYRRKQKGAPRALLGAVMLLLAAGFMLFLSFG